MNRLAFLSHASADAALAHTICAGLESRGVTCWIAPRDVSYGGTYGPDIAVGVREAAVFVVLVSDAAAASGHVEREAAIATEAGKSIVPVMVGRGDPGRQLQYWLAGRQRFPCSSSPDAAWFDTLAAAIRRHGAQSGPDLAGATARSTSPPVHGADTSPNRQQRFIVVC